MLPAFVIGLREGLETVVILGAIVVFVRVQGRRDLLPRLWRACALAALICVGFALVVRFVEINLAWRQQEQLETIVGFAAVCMVTYMVVWMRRFPKDLERDSRLAANAALARGSGRALVALAFFAVLREGFEIVVFVVATIGLAGDNSWLATGGALLGIVVALAIGVGIVRGSRHVDIVKFFRVSAFVLVLSAAGIAMGTVHTANAAGWITFGQTTQFDLSWLAPPGSVLSSITTGMFGLLPYPVIVEVVAWFVYFVPMSLVVLWPRRATPAPSGDAALGAGVLAPSSPDPVLRRRVLPRWSWRWSGVVALVAIGVGTGAYLATSGPGGLTRHVASRSAPAGVLYATLDDVTCPMASHCVAVGEYLPDDKDAAIGDPDGDGQATHTLVEVSDGSSWKRIASPDEGRGGAVLSSVACPSMRDCVAVGFYRSAPYGAATIKPPASSPLIESFDGRAWHVVRGPDLPPNTVLTSVSCPDTSHCVAVGATTENLNSHNPTQRFIVESLDGQTWQATQPPAIVDASSALTAVSCPSAASCVAVGNVAPARDPTATRPLIETLSTGGWREASLPPDGDGPGILYDVTCVGVTRCIAVGSSVALRTSGSGLVLESAGSTWSTDTTVLALRGDASLTSIACIAAVHCVVAGNSTLSLSDAPVKLLARLDGTTWQSLASRASPDAVDAVDCWSEAHCIGVGSVSVNIFGNTTALVASLSSTGWAPEPSPLP